jgi:hypothetical protein
MGMMCISTSWVVRGLVKEKREEETMTVVEMHEG